MINPDGCGVGQLDQFSERFAFLPEILFVFVYVFIIAQV